MIADGLQRGASGHRNRRRLFVGDRSRLRDEPRLAAASVFGERPARDAEHLVARAEPRDSRTDRLDLAGNVATWTPADRIAPTHHAEKGRFAAHQVPVKGICCRRANPDQDALVVDRRLVDLAKLEILRRPVSVVGDGFHGCLNLTAPRAGRFRLPTKPPKKALKGAFPRFSHKGHED